jgi:hypothetical protein
LSLGSKVELFRPKELLSSKMPLSLIINEFLLARVMF